MSPIGQILRSSPVTGSGGAGPRRRIIYGGHLRRTSIQALSRQASSAQASKQTQASRHVVSGTSYATPMKIVFESRALRLHGRTNLFGLSKAGGEVTKPGPEAKTMELMDRNKHPPPTLPRW